MTCPFVPKYLNGGFDMYLRCYDEVKGLTKDLVQIPSVVKTSGEAHCAKWIYNYYNELDYFKQNPEHLMLQQTLNDEIERYNTISMVKGRKGNSNKTIILMGHLDTVGVEDFGDMEENAFNSEELMKQLRNLNLGEDVNRDIDSGDYMFGRGALDMKAGVAGQMYIMKYFSQHPDLLDGNLIAIAEADEEDNSHGIISALKILKEWKELYDLEYIAAINADYSTPYHEEDENRYIYFGTIGKLLPSFYVTGKETHVGQAYGGLDPNLIVAELTRNIELNTDLCDESHGEVTIPPISLKQSDLKPGYTVQTALAAYSYYNYFTLTMSPKEVMDKMLDIATLSFDNIVNFTNNSYKTYCEKSGHTYTRLPWVTRVYSWEDFYNELATIHGDRYTVYIRNFALDLHEQNPSMDLREFSMKIIDESWKKWSDDKSPAIIIYFSSLYYASIEISGQDKQEVDLIQSVTKAIHFVQDYTDKPIVKKMFYPYISDSSFMAISDDREGLRALEGNMPAWGTKYNHPIEEIKAINVPVVNIGTYGKDGHKITERVHMKYSFENIPNITFKAIKNLLG